MLLLDRTTKGTLVVFHTLSLKRDEVSVSSASLTLQRSVQKEKRAPLGQNVKVIEGTLAVKPSFEMIDNTNIAK